MSGLYEEEVRCIRVVSAIAGPGEETTTLTELSKGGGILAAFADDEDIQEITVCSTNIGMIRTYTKRFRK